MPLLVEHQQPEVGVGGNGVRELQQRALGDVDLALVARALALAPCCRTRRTRRSSCASSRPTDRSRRRPSAVADASMNGHAASAECARARPAAEPAAGARRCRLLCGRLAVPAAARACRRRRVRAARTRQDDPRLHLDSSGLNAEASASTWITRNSTRMLRSHSCSFFGAHGSLPQTPLFGMRDAVADDRELRRVEADALRLGIGDHAVAHADRARHGSGSWPTCCVRPSTTGDAPSFFACRYAKRIAVAFDGDHGAAVGGGEVGDLLEGVGVELGRELVLVRLEQHLEVEELAFAEPPLALPPRDDARDLPGRSASLLLGGDRRARRPRCRAW